MSTPRPGGYARFIAPKGIGDAGIFKVVSIKGGEVSLARATVWEDTKVIKRVPASDLAAAEPSEMDLLGYGYFPYLKIVTDRVRGGETFDQAVRRLPNVKRAPVEVRDLLQDLIGKSLARKVAAKHEQKLVMARLKEAGWGTDFPAVGDGPVGVLSNFMESIDLEFRAMWDRPATPDEIREIYRNVFSPLEHVDYDEPLNVWVDAASEAFDLPNSVILSLDESALDEARRLWDEYEDAVDEEEGDMSRPANVSPSDDVLDAFLSHVSDALWPEDAAPEPDAEAAKSVKTAAYKTTGDGSSVGFFIPLPKELAEQFPSLGDEDRSPPHVTLLYVGKVPKSREAEFIAVSKAALAKQPGPVIATLGEPDYFVHPDKDRRVWYSRVTFSNDLAEVRDRLWLALEDAGFTVGHSFPLASFPHVTLAYVPGAHSHERWDGPVPTGAWTFDSLEVWGMSKDVEVPLGTYQAQDFADVARATVRVAAGFPKDVDHQALYQHVYDTLRNKRIPRWDSFAFNGREIAVYYPDPGKGIADSLWIQFPGSMDTYQWSPRAKKWLKARRPLPPEEEEIKERELTQDEKDFYRLPPDEMVEALRGIPRSMLSVMDFRIGMLPAVAIDYLVSQGYRFKKSGASSHRVAARWAADQIPGGLGDEKKPSDFDKAQVEKGTRVEMEHTNDRAVAREIAVDHLTEDPKYYDKLEKIEKHGGEITMGARGLTSTFK
mgnify:CR=1 FL=1